MTAPTDPRPGSAAHGGGGLGRGGRHYALAAPVFGGRRLEYRAWCPCGYYRQQTNTKRENAIRAARRHVQEAQS